MSAKRRVVLAVVAALALMRNDFSGHQVSPHLEDGAFSLELEPDYEVTTPLEGRR